MLRIFYSKLLMFVGGSRGERRKPKTGGDNEPCLAHSKKLEENGVGETLKLRFLNLQTTTGSTESKCLETS